MGRPPVIPPEKKTRIVLAVLSGEVSIVEAARKEKVSLDLVREITSPGTVPATSISATPTRQSPPSNATESCQLLDAGQ